MADDRHVPTMIIPAGAEISAGGDRQLAIRTPGNLVIQNSGSFSAIECVNGSLRIDAGVRVEAETVRVAETCMVAGSLTAWQVHTKRLVLERGSQAAIILLQAESVELDRQARLVGNFGSEKELSSTLGRFGERLRGLAQAAGEERPVPLRKVDAAGADSTRGRRPPDGSS
jgi:hypothetical protein